ncbi:palmitoyl-protein thioesterase 1-like protein [Dinothrombium tinctorium]|uniref:Palmitoyl-protein thioesterase 1 n=1 Tax=Dinothrombium tinctorium TaxID=1965070 RepID=A0A3S3NNC8_9ACAR|nr:palmitoyl-protein thioesterase 1-like protein [Dinothrombium tinctorium]
MFKVLSVLLLIVLLNLSKAENDAKPIVIWHGMGDTCCAAGSMGYIKKHLEKKLNVYVHSLRIGDNVEQDFLNSYFMNCNDQIDYACNLIKNDSKLKDGFNLLGFSQGGQFVRALVQRCDNITVYNLITFGAQHQGVYGLPRCPGENETICNLVRKLLSYGAYTDFVQRHVVQAQYWHSPVEEEEYVKKSLFLADINNERLPRKQIYKERLLRLKSFVMVSFRDDTIVDPIITELFGYYKPNQAKIVQILQDTTLYTEDWLGLKELDESNRLKMYTVPGNHLHITMDWFDSEIINKYLR